MENNTHTSWSCSQEFVKQKDISYRVMNFYYTWYRKDDPFDLYELKTNNVKPTDTQSQFIKILDIAFKKIGMENSVIVFPPQKGDKTQLAWLREFINKNKYSAILIKSDEYPRLSSEKNVRDRLDRLESAFSSWTHEWLNEKKENPRYIYIDDIFTSGSTMGFVIKYLKKQSFQITCNQVQYASGAPWIEVDQSTFMGIFLGRTFSESNQKSEYVHVYKSTSNW